MNHKILIVDDERDDVKLLKIRLEKNGYNVTSSPDGEDALEKIADFLPNLILLDIKLPKIDGYKVLQWLRTQPQVMETPVIFSTADASVEVKKKVEELGANDCVIKPYDTKELLGKIDTLLKN